MPPCKWPHASLSLYLQITKPSSRYSIQMEQYRQQCVAEGRLLGKFAHFTISASHIPFCVDRSWRGASKDRGVTWLGVRRETSCTLSTKRQRDVRTHLVEGGLDSRVQPIMDRPRKETWGISAHRHQFFGRNALQTFSRGSWAARCPTRHYLQAQLKAIGQPQSFWSISPLKKVRRSTWLEGRDRTHGACGATETHGAQRGQDHEGNGESYR